MPPASPPQLPPATPSPLPPGAPPKSPPVPQYPTGLGATSMSPLGQALTGEATSSSAITIVLVASSALLVGCGLCFFMHLLHRSKLQIVEAQRRSSSGQNRRPSLTGIRTRCGGFRRPSEIRMNFPRQSSIPGVILPSVEHSEPASSTRSRAFTSQVVSPNPLTIHRVRYTVASGLAVSNPIGQPDLGKSGGNASATELRV
mmetsp:Transcript_37675/g.110368  ORF Transcript_37675/g.110368 Transcript_37675/m.110368 type:complete len:201 (+) Transcript_37675:1278-1880(+)